MVTQYLIAVGSGYSMPTRCVNGIQWNPLQRITQSYCIAGNFGGSKFWRMTQILHFGEFNFGTKSLDHVLLQ